MLRECRQVSLRSLFVLTTVFPLALLAARVVGPYVTLIVVIAFIAFLWEPPVGNPIIMGVSYFLIASITVFLLGVLLQCSSGVLVVTAILLPPLAYLVGFAKSV